MSKFIRQTHRCLAIIFTLAVIANLLVQGREQLAFWVGSLTLIPLFLLLFTGLYMFVLPYAARWRGQRLARE